MQNTKESYRQRRGLPWLETLAKDARYALRGLRQSPGFTTVAVLSLALGIGAATAVFSVVNAILLRPLPYAEPERVITVGLTDPNSKDSDFAISAPLFEIFRREAGSLEDASLFIDWNFSLAGEGEPERIPSARVSASLFHVLGVAPQLGRAFTPDEDQPGRENVVLISDRLWRRRFNADPGVLGRTITLNDRPHTIIGVMPPAFQFPNGPELPYIRGFPPAQIWRPMALVNWERTSFGSVNFAMLARLRPGSSPAQARGELTGLLRRTIQALPRSGVGGGVAVRTLRETLTGKTRPAVLIVFAAVAAVLLIACVNVANLLIARGLKRRTEIAVRLSLGAAPARIARQLLTESLVLALCATAVAVLLAGAGVRALVAMAPAGVFGLDAAALDARVLAFTIVAALVTSLLFGAVPAFETARQSPAEAIKGGGRTASARRSRLQPALVVAEFALSLVLLVSAALLAQSFTRVARTPLGFHAENVLTLRLTLPDPKYDDRRRAALVEQLAANCAALPGVTAAAAVSTLPLTGESEGHGILSDYDPDSKQYLMSRFRAVTPAYFRTLGIRLRAGREFTSADRDSSPVAIISALAAGQLWPGIASPVGRKLHDGRGWKTVVGVVDDTRASGVDAEIRPYVYVPFWHFAPDEFALAVRSSGDPARLTAAIKSEVWRIDKDQPVTHVAVMRQLVADSIASRRYPAVLVAAFAGFALALAAIGVYGVVSYSVARRTHEIGIRMALGASRIDVLSGVLQQALLLALLGSALGLAAAFALTPLLRGLLYGVSPAEPGVFAASALVLVGVAALACIVPALRAAKLDPVTSLRCE